MPESRTTSTAEKIYSVYLVDVGPNPQMIMRYMQRFLGFTPESAAATCANLPAKVMGPVAKLDAEEVTRDLRKYESVIELGSKHTAIPGMERISERRESIEADGNARYFYSVFQSAKDIAIKFPKLDVEGRLKAEDAEEFKSAMESVHEMGSKNLILDLSPLEYISDVAVGMVAEMASTVHEAGGQLMLLAPQGGQVRAALEGLHLI